MEATDLTDVAEKDETKGGIGESPTRLGDREASDATDGMSRWESR